MSAYLLSLPSTASLWNWEIGVVDLVGIRGGVQFLALLASCYRSHARSWCAKAWSFRLCTSCVFGGFGWYCSGGLVCWDIPDCGEWWVVVQPSDRPATKGVGIMHFYYWISNARFWSSAQSLLYWCSGVIFLKVPLPLCQTGAYFMIVACWRLNFLFLTLFLLYMNMLPFWFLSSLVSWKVSGCSEAMGSQVIL